MAPVLEIFGVSIPSFVLVLVLMSSLGLAWVDHRASVFGIPRRQALDLALLILVGGFFGARLLHVVWEAPAYYLEDFRRLADLQSGGFVAYGGLLFGGALAFAALKWWIKANPIGPWLDVFTPVLSFGFAFGRLGCFLAGCCFGKACALPWAFPLADEKGLVLLRHPVPLYLFLWEIGVLFVLLGLESMKPQQRWAPLRGAGRLFWLWLLLYSVGRFFSEFFRGDFRGPEWGLSLSQWLSLALILGSCLILRRGLASSQSDTN